MKKIIMWKADAAGCGKARIEVPSKYINQNFGNEIYTEPSDIMNPNTWLDNNNKPIWDIAVLQRQYGLPNLQNAMYLKRIGTKLVYEIDDYLHGIHPLSAAYMAYNPKKFPERFLNMEMFMKISDGMTVTTECLKRLYGKFNKNVYVLPNCLDIDEYYSAIEKPDHGDEIWLGWAGSNTHLPDLRIAVGAIERIMKDFPQVRLCLGGWDGYFRTKDGTVVNPELYVWKNIPKEKIIVIPWAKDMKDYSKMLANFDIGIVPLEDCTFNRAKSNIKWLEYSACGVPTIASKVEPYEISIKNNENGLLVQANGAMENDWYLKIKKMVLDKQLRIDIANNAKQHVLENYDAKKKAYLWKEVYEKICG